MFKAVEIDREKIKLLREKRGWSIAEAAKRAGMRSRSLWSDVEYGRSDNITIHRLNDFARALGVSAASLLKSVHPDDAAAA